MLMMAMSVGAFIGALLLTGRNQPSFLEASGLMVAAVGTAVTVLMATRTIFVHRGASKARTLRRKVRRARWTVASLGMTAAGATTAIGGGILAG